MFPTLSAIFLVVNVIFGISFGVASLMPNNKLAGLHLVICLMNVASAALQVLAIVNWMA